MKNRRRIRKVYVIEMNYGLATEILKIVADEKLAETYMRKYTEKYPKNHIICNEADYVETI